MRWSFTFVVCVLLCFCSCGGGSSFNPESILYLVKADPPTEQIDVNPPNARVVYFVFNIRLTDPNLSTLPKDKWVINKVNIRYTIQNDPGHHLQNPPSDEVKKLGSLITPGSSTRVSVQIIDPAYLQVYGGGFIGTSDTAKLKVHLAFNATRKVDGVKNTLSMVYPIVLGDFP